MINGIDYLRKMYPNRDEKDYQPSGLDLRLGKVFQIDDTFTCGIYGGEKVSAPLIELPIENYCQYKMYDGWLLEYNKPYIFEVQEQIKIGESNAQFYLPRSTLLRNGVNVYTALGDLGYNGKLQFLVINHRPKSFFIEKGERFAQLVDFQVRGGSTSYNGDYQEEVEWDIGNRIQF